MGVVIVRGVVQMILRLKAGYPLRAGDVGAQNASMVDLLETGCVFHSGSIHFICISAQEVDPAQGIAGNRDGGVLAADRLERPFCPGGVR